MTGDLIPLDRAACADANASAQVEGILFVADRPVSLSELALALDLDRKVVEQALRDLEQRSEARGVRLQRSNGHVQLVSAPEVADAVQRFLGLENTVRLSGAALETLSIIAYRQPMTRPEMEAVRGVGCDGVLRTLLMRGLVAPIGRRATVGHPVEYGTTFQFLEYFGLKSLAELPPLGELAEPDPAPSNGVLAADPGAHRPAGDAATAADDGRVATVADAGHG